MRYKGCHQAHNAQVVICAFFTTPNSLKLQERRKAFSQSSCHIAKVVLALTAAKSPQRLTRRFAKPPAVSSLGGLRTPAPVCAAPPSWGRHPKTFTKSDLCVDGDLGLTTRSEAALEPPRFIRRMLTGSPTSVHRQAWSWYRACTRWHCAPGSLLPAVAVPRSARVVGPHCVVRGATN
jgi:hypothetical protein